jgi:chromosomal replication initiation ATPase DnaA
MKVRFRPATRKDVIHHVCNVFEVSERELISWKRQRYLAVARWAAYYTMYHGLQYSYPKIGKIMDMDHTTIMYGVKKAEGIIEGQWEKKYDGREFRENLERIYSLCGLPVFC